jgi:transcriptional regulator with XRE-family HTH domain
MVQATEYIERLKQLRNQHGMSLRDLAKAADMAPASLSAIESGQSSPTLASFHKLLKALGTDFNAFFSNESAGEPLPVFPSGTMQLLEDVHRTYRMLLPRRDDLRFEMISEVISVTEGEGEWETHDCDVGGVLIEGGPVRLDLEDKGSWTLKEGDAFYIHARQKHRAVVTGSKPAKLITVYDPPRY